MAQATRIKGGKVRVLLDLTGGGTYAAQCGFTSRSVSISKGLNEYQVPDCDDPDAVSWMGRDATSLSMTVSGEGVLASESVENWLDAIESPDPTAVKIEWEFPSKTITWTGAMHVEGMDSTAPNSQTATMSVTMQSDGEMVRVVT